ncbi:MAG TPA: hypothetical protein VI864_05925 [Candidatus Bathyarchaeia archaeon]|nr:hypothetical protein [Candidatus Bathyarchaeia archaeon]
MKGNFLFCKSAIAKALIVAIVVILVVGIAVGVYCLSFLAGNFSLFPTPQPTPTPTPVELGEAVTSGLVEATISGDGLQRINITLRSTSDSPLEVTILPGTMFETQSAGIQSMVVREERVLSLKSRDSVLSRSVPVACATMELDQPDEKDPFTISTIPAPEDLVKLLNLPDFRNETFRVQQFAIWTITDNPPRDGYVGIGSFGFGSGPDDEEMQKIRALFEKAGIPADKYQALQ